MSYVTNVMLNTPTLDRQIAKRFAEETWQDSQGSRLRSLTDIGPPSDMWGGTKHVEADLWGGAFNYLNLDDLLTEIAAVDWQFPDEVQVFVLDEGDDRWTVRVLGPDRRWVVLTEPT